MTTRVFSVSVPVADQDAALRFYTEVLDCELRTYVEVWPGARMVEVAPPGSSVSLVLLPVSVSVCVISKRGDSRMCGSGGPDEVPRSAARAGAVPGEARGPVPAASPRC